MKTCRAALVATLWLFGGAPGVAQYGPTAPLFVAVTIDGYISETYTERPVPPSTYVYFTGERIEHMVRTANQEQAELTIDFPSGVDDAVRVAEAVKIDPVTGGETPVRFSLRLDSVSKLTNRIHRSAVTDTNAIAFQYQDQVEWHFHLRERPAVGHYRVSVSFLGQDRDGRRILPMSSQMNFEVRESSRYPAEILLREAYRNARPEGNLKRAERALTRLLAINPNSAVGYHFLATIADLRGNAPLARRHRETSEAIGKSGRDQLRSNYCDALCRAIVQHD